MGIRVCEEKKIFSISTPNTTYLMGVSGENLLGHMYYGKRMEDMDGYYLLRSGDSPEEKHNHLRDKVGYLDLSLIHI